MARRVSSELNAGSMADISFLLLVFFLVVTTMNADKGIKRLLPSPLIIKNPTKVNERNVYEVMVNFKNELWVEQQPMSISELRNGAKKFIMANGDNILKTLSDPIVNLPVRKVLNQDSVISNAILLEKKLERLKARKSISKDLSEIQKLKAQIKTNQSILNDLYAKQYAFEYFGNFAVMPSSALISVRNDDATAYETYVAVNNELEAAIRELRDELCLLKFGVKFHELDFTDENDKKKILAIRVVYPQRISEADPLKSK